jgi:hypothetical protein
MKPRCLGETPVLRASCYRGATGLSRPAASCCASSSRRLMGRVPACALALLSLACGYSPAYVGTRPAQQLTVAAAPSLAPESGALSALLNGLRGELSRAGVLRAGTGYPRAVLELLRVDERGAGMAVQLSQPSATPLTRGATVGVTARAWVEDSPNSRPYHDTGDVRRVYTVATGSTLAADALAHDSAVEQAGFATGQAIGRRLLGEVEPALEPL